MPVEHRTPPVQVLRAQVSHSWLDHEILLLSPAEAVLRWEAGDWGRLRKEFRAHRQRAWALLDRMEEFSGHLLFDTPEAQADMPAPVRERLRANTLSRWRAAVGCAALRADYTAALEGLELALERFQSSVGSASTTRADVAGRWEEVLERARALKHLFASERIPREVAVAWNSKS